MIYYLLFTSLTKLYNVYKLELQVSGEVGDMICEPFLVAKTVTVHGEIRG